MQICVQDSDFVHMYMYILSLQYKDNVKIVILGGKHFFYILYTIF